jgi:hypothetical protein
MINLEDPRVVCEGARVRQKKQMPRSSCGKLEVEGSASWQVESNKVTSGLDHLGAKVQRY